MNTRVSWIDPDKLGDVLARLMPAADAPVEVREPAAAPEIIPADFLSAPEPAPNSQTSQVWVTERACATCAARALPKNGDISGAVTKSLPCPFTPLGMVPKIAPSLV